VSVVHRAGLALFACSRGHTGETGTGKSTLLAGLASGSTTSAGPSVAATMPSSSSSTNLNGHVNGVSATPEVRDLGLGYAYWDVRDDDGEGESAPLKSCRCAAPTLKLTRVSSDILARVGVYQVPSSHPLHVSLLPLALQPPQLASSSAGPSAKADALRSTLWLLVLDWSNPSAFFDQLLTWLDIVGQTTREALGVPETQKGAKWGREQEFARELQEGGELQTRESAEPNGPSSGSRISRIHSQWRRTFGHTSSRQRLLRQQDPVFRRQMAPRLRPRCCQRRLQAWST